MASKAQRTELRTTERRGEMAHFTMYDIELANRQAGFHWFDPSSKRFFRSRYGQTVYHGPGGIYFVSSEQFEGSMGNRAERLFTVRLFDPETGNVGTVGAFNVLTRHRAHALAVKCVAGKVEARREDENIREYEERISLFS